MSILRPFLNVAKGIYTKMLPAERNHIVFTSFSGHYSDSPKALSEAIHALRPSIKITWLVSPERMADLPDYVDGVDINSFSAAIAKGKAGIIIDNVYGDKSVALESEKWRAVLKYRFRVWMRCKKRQHVYTTWHGTPLKRMGRDQIGETIYQFSCPDTTMILPNQYTLDIMQHLTFEKITMKLLGCPRNDLLYAQEDEKEKIKERLGLPTDKKIILFAPTFRTNSSKTTDTNIKRSGIRQLQEMDFLKLCNALAQQFGGDWVLVCRFHYHVADRIPWPELEQKYPGSIINGNTCDDMAQYLACTDVLLTDASSCMFDFAITGKPCFLYFPDLRYYVEEERGLYCDIRSLPFPLSESFDALIDKITHFDNAAYQNGVAQMMDKFGYVDKPNMAYEVANYILSENNL